MFGSAGLPYVCWQSRRMGASKHTERGTCRWDLEQHETDIPSTSSFFFIFSVIYAVGFIVSRQRAFGCSFHIKHFSSKYHSSRVFQHRLSSSWGGGAAAICGLMAPTCHPPSTLIYGVGPLAPLPAQIRSRHPPFVNRFLRAVRYLAGGRGWNGRGEGINVQAASRP